MKKRRNPIITSKIMSCVRSKNTKPELVIRKILRRNNLRFRAHHMIVGRPDFVILPRKIAIFVDGDFWHGNNWKLRGFKSIKHELASYKRFWREKITRNIARDKTVTRELKNMGWKVLRIWESDILKRPQFIEKRIAIFMTSPL